MKDAWRMKAARMVAFTPASQADMCGARGLAPFPVRRPPFRARSRMQGIEMPAQTSDGAAAPACQFFPSLLFSLLFSLFSGNNRETSGKTRRSDIGAQGTSTLYEIEAPA
jgi:hypothetical protein